MLSEEDRRIIKESGSLHRFLQESTPLLLVKDTLVMLKGYTFKNLEENSAKGHSLDKSRRATLYCVWSCENCGFSNSFDMAFCKRCHNAVSGLEESSIGADDFANSARKTNDCDYRSSTSVSTNVDKNLAQENSKSKAAVSAELTFCTSKAEECSTVSEEKCQRERQSPTAFELKEMETCMLKKASKSMQNNDATKSVQLMDEHRLKEKYVISNTSKFSSIETIYTTVGKLEENRTDLHLDTWDSEKWEEIILAPDSRYLLQTESHRETPSIISYSKVESLDILSEKGRTSSPHQCKEDVLEDSGITGDQVLCAESGCKECHGDPEKKDKPSLLHKYHTDYIAKDVGQECLPGDNIDDTFFSVQSSSCCSICSNSSLPFSLDDLNDTEGVNAEVSALNMPGLEEVRANSKRTVSCNTEPSWILNYITEEKESQTISTETQDVSVNTDISLTFCNPMAQNVLNEGAGDGCAKVGLAVNWKAKSSDALMQRAIKAELQLLNTQRMFCRQLCCKAHQRSLEKQCALSLNGAPLEQLTETSPLNLVSALAEVEEIYEKIKAKILSGVALDDMVSLSAQLTKVDIAAESLTGSFQPSVVEAFKSISDVFVDKKEDTLITSLPAKAQDQSMEQKNTSPTSEVPEDWFDAQENITMESPKDLSECIKELNKKDDVTENGIVMSSDLNENEMKKPVSTQSGCMYVHVGNIAHSITEKNLLMYFEKYHVCKVYLQELSIKSSYAVLTFDDATQAQAAVKEMDGKELCGRKIKVRHIKNSQDSLLKAFQTLLPGSTKTENQRPVIFSSKLSSKDSNTKPTLSTPAHAGGDVAQKGSYYKKSEDASLNTQNYGRPVPQTIPFWVPPASPNMNPPVPPWMVPSLLSSLVAMQTPWAFTYAGPQYSSPYPPCAPVCAPFPPQASYIQPRSMHSSSGAIAKNEKNDLCATTKSSEPRKGSSKGSGILSSSVKDLKQIARSLKEGPVSRAATVTVPVKVNTAQTETPSSALNYSSHKAKAPAKTSTSAGNLSVQSLDPIGVATTEVTKTVAVTKVTQISSTTVPLRVPSFVPLTVTIPKPETGDNAQSYTKLLSVSSKAPTGHASLNHPVTAPVAFKLASKPISASKIDQTPVDEDPNVFPVLDPSSELPVHIIPNRLNLSSFDKLMARLTGLHPGVQSNEIINTLQELRASRGGFLSGLSIENIVMKVSSMLINKPKV
ncbi:RNA-binding protein 44 isoform X2 [Xenopus laevis]|nr:RNA-binding protein 44 isoform X2 [Xenopus laevis]XP_041431880.1 RNA-binding protein 44 isoform X2 [Xenopus laevis]OCT63989.1 hypothetical protein XELAEV_18045087mg [Xenopus laevis]